MIDIRRHATERHEQSVKIPTALFRVRSIQSQKLNIHRKRTYKACRNDLVGQRFLLSEIDIEFNPFGSRSRFIIIIDVVFIDRTCRPVKKIRSRKKIEHSFRRPSTGIKASDNSAHRRTCHVIDRNIVIFQSFYDADMGYAFGPAATQHKADFSILFSDLIVTFCYRQFFRRQRIVTGNVGSKSVIIRHVAVIRLLRETADNRHKHRHGNSHHSV